jgi:hypothetical protein
MTVDRISGARGKNKNRRGSKTLTVTPESGSTESDILPVRLSISGLADLNIEPEKRLMGSHPNPTTNNETMNARVVRLRQLHIIIHH